MLPEKLKKFVKKLDEAQLRELNVLVVDRLKFFSQVRNFKKVQKFSPFDQVVFHHDDEDIYGVVIRVNQKTVTIRTNDQGEWRVNPQFLEKVVGVDNEKVLDV